MKIVFDHQIFMGQKYGGISRYFCEIGQQYAKLGNQVSILAPIYINNYLNEINQPNFNIKGFKVPNISKGSGFLSSCSMMANKSLLKFMDYDVIHETFFTENGIGSKNKPTFITVYDMIHELYPDSFSLKDKTSYLKKKSVERADRIISISHSTKNDLIKFFNVDEKKIDVIHLSYTSFGNSQEKKWSQKPYILFVGGRSGYKNFLNAVKAYSLSYKLRESFDFICFGGGDWSIGEKEILRELKIENQVKLVLGGDDKLAELYSGAQCMIYPSLYEGFGLPPLEAMAHGCPCVVSNTSSIPEVCGTAALYFNPENIDEISHALERICFNTELGKVLIENGKKRIKEFSWERCARETLDSYRKLL